MQQSRRNFSKAMVHAPFLAFWCGVTDLAYGQGLLAVRVWPAVGATRVTLESELALVAKHQLLSDPLRLVLNIEGLDLNPQLREWIANIKPDDPFIGGVRVAQQAAHVVRLVFDLKQSVVPQVFNLPPVPAVYQHRLVVDLVPSRPTDPLDALIASWRDDPLGDWIAKNGRAAASSKSDSKAATPTHPTSSAQVGEDLHTSKALNKARQWIVAIDPGHGGEDPGAIGPAGTKEKDVVLQIALQLRDRLQTRQQDMGKRSKPLVRAFVTRDGDYFVPLHERVRKAQRAQADLFISIHADAFYTPTARGASVFALSTKAASSAAAKWLAEKENQADTVGGLNIAAKDAFVKRAILDMSTTAQIKDSLKVGKSVLGEMRQMAQLHKPQVEQANFAVLKAPDIPSVLVETAFISHPQEEQLLKDPAYQTQLVGALHRAILRYFAALPTIT